MPAPRMAGADTLHSQPAALERPVLFYRLHTIIATRRYIAALGAKQRRQKCLVESYQPGKEYREYFTHLPCLEELVQPA